MKQLCVEVNNIKTVSFVLVKVDAFKKRINQMGHGNYFHSTGCAKLTHFV